MNGARSAKRGRAAAILAALVLALAACRTVPELPAALRDAPQAPRDDRPPRVALVLGGGAARGFAHVGVLAVLEEARVPVELIVGASVGSLVGAIYADGRNRYELEQLTRDLERDDFFDFGITPALFGTGLASGDRLEEWARDHLRARRIEDLRIQYAAVATDLDTGAAVVLRSGDLARAVRASCAVPGVFQPVVQEGRLLVDGGVVSNLPVREARALGADVVIAVDVTALAGKARPKNFVEVILRAVNILANEGVEEAAREADVLVAPAVGELGLMDFDAKEKAIAAGEVAAREALPRIRDAIARVQSASRGTPRERSASVFVLASSPTRSVRGARSEPEPPDSVRRFRDDPRFFTTVRGYRSEKQPRATRANIDRLVAHWHPLHREYVRELFLGFIAEADGRLADAEAHYRRTLEIPVHDEESYYGHLDLARAALKRGAMEEARTHLATYLDGLSQGIRAGEGYATEMPFGYTPPPQSLPSMRSDRQRLERVLAPIPRD